MISFAGHFLNDQHPLATTARLSFHHRTTVGLTGGSGAGDLKPTLELAQADEDEPATPHDAEFMP